MTQPADIMNAMILASLPSGGTGKSARAIHAEIGIGAVETVRMRLRHLERERVAISDIVPASRGGPSAKKKLYRRAPEASR